MKQLSISFAHTIADIDYTLEQFEAALPRAVEPASVLAEH